MAIELSFYQELPIISDGYEVVNSLEIFRYIPFPSEMIGKISFYGKTVNSIKNKDVRISKRLIYTNK